MIYYNALFDRDGICYAITNKEINSYYKQWKYEYKNKEDFFNYFQLEKITKIEKDYIESFDGYAHLMSDLNNEEWQAVEWIEKKKNYKYDAQEKKLYYNNVDITDLIIF